MNELGYPVLLWFHIVVLMAWGGFTLQRPGWTRPKLVCALAALFSGAVLVLVKPAESVGAPWFWAKLAFVALLVAADSLRAPRAAVLVLWIGAIGAARGPATVKDVMGSMVDPSADFLFESVRTESDENGIREIAPRTDEEWENVRERLAVLQQVRDVLSGPRIHAARARDRAATPEIENEPAEVQQLLDANRADFARRAQKLHDAASIAMRAADSKDKDALLIALDGIDKACEVCHLRYWYPKDQRAIEAAKASGILE